MEWPDRGVYFFFEEGEHLKDQKGISRVVRVGTHAITIGAQATLWQRLRQHKGNENGNFGENGGNSSAGDGRVAVILKKGDS